MTPPPRLLAREEIDALLAVTDARTAPMRGDYSAARFATFEEVRSLCRQARAMAVLAERSGWTMGTWNDDEWHVSDYDGNFVGRGGPDPVSAIESAEAATEGA